MVKTNAIRMLEAANVRFTASEYSSEDGKIDGISVAHKIGAEPERVFKTLVTSGKNTGFNVFIVPAECELDLKKAAAAVGDKYIEMIKAKDLEPLTGYVHGGCSPFGMKKALPTYIEEAASLYETIYVSGGQIGLQVELPPDELIRVANAAYCDLV
jgi:Cys-tRNA(Pro)/Cys-tRNA(Cys) deacylase